MYIRKELSSKVLHHCTVYALHRNSKGFCHSSLGSMWCVNAHLRNHKQAGQYDISLWCNYYTHMRVTSLWGLRRSMTNDYANAYQTKALYSLTVTHMMMRKCVPHTTYHTFLLLPMIYANVYQTKALLSLFSYSHTHDDIRNCVPHTKYHTYSVSRLWSLSYAIRIYAYIKYFHIYMLIRICVRGG